MKQETFTDIEHSFRRKKTKREGFLEIMDVGARYSSIHRCGSRPASCFGTCGVIGVSFMGISKDKPSGRYDISRTSAPQSLDIENLPRLPSWIWRIAGKQHNRPYTRSILLSGYRVSEHFYDSLHFLPLIQTKRLSLRSDPLLLC